MWVVGRLPRCGWGGGDGAQSQSSSGTSPFHCEDTNPGSGCEGAGPYAHSYVAEQLPVAAAERHARLATGVCHIRPDGVRLGPNAVCAGCSWFLLSSACDGGRVH